MNTWYYAFFIGLAGSWHCLAMCGPVIHQVQRRGKAPYRIVLFPAGRIFMYTILGFMVSFMGSIWLFPSWWYVYYLLAGVVIMLVIYFKSADRLFLILHTSVGKYLQKSSIHWGNGGYFLLGMSHGLLPCGLVLAGLSVSIIQPNPYLGGLTMALFGLSTLLVTPLVHFGTQKLKHPIFSKIKYMTWLIAMILFFRGAWGIAMSQSAYIRHSKISVIVCHPFAEIRIP